MTVFGWVAGIVGAVLFFSALLETLRANPMSRVPFFRNTGTVPAGAMTMRVVGSALLVFAAVALSATLGAWAIVFALAGPVIALTAISSHNHSVEARQAADDDETPRTDSGGGVSLHRPLLTTFDGWNWIPTSWGALVVVVALAVLLGVIISWLS